MSPTGSGLETLKQWAAKAVPRWMVPTWLKSCLLCARPAWPKGWERLAQLQDGRRVLLRPLHPEDETLYPRFLDQVTAEDRRLRFFVSIKEFSAARIAQFTHFDFTKAMAFVALDQMTEELLGVARLHRLPHVNTAEFAILVRSDLKGHGLGWILMNLLIEYGQRLRLSAIEGDVLPDNEMMLKMCAELGFHVSTNPADATLKSVWLPLGWRRRRLVPPQTRC
jgi:RimJ/RimL family protein N-acetyltransferase